uniref:Uncharacterized protein n=1 Tax=Caulerpa lentillifera TaxID=148947 RepID=A0A2Z2QKJ4_9CHLO|nr:hypothetical protein [Caulerpa lentillifera]AST24267.1 hypothetical protein [Caulerpa lentillifera]
MRCPALTGLEWQHARAITSGLEAKLCSALPWPLKIKYRKAGGYTRVVRFYFSERQPYCSAPRIPGRDVLGISTRLLGAYEPNSGDLFAFAFRYNRCWLFFFFAPCFSPCVQATS